MTNFKIAVIGDKDFADYAQMKSTLDSFINIHEGKTISIISGSENSIDLLAKKYALDNNIEFECYPIDKSRYGSVAALARNRVIVNGADRVIAFWRGKTSETKNAIEEAERTDIPSYIVGIDP